MPLNKETKPNQEISLKVGHNTAETTKNSSDGTLDHNTVTRSFKKFGLQKSQQSGKFVLD